jgi:hypothetical protein
VEAGYEYVVVDGVHVRPEDGLSDIYRPYLASHEGVCITVVPRDRSISNGQESGLDPVWLASECQDHTNKSPRPEDPRLVTTWSDGENGGWFRQTHEESGFFGHFFAPYMRQVRAGESRVIPTALSRYLRAHVPTARAQVQTGAWNVGTTSGEDLSQWAGSESQRKAVGVVRDLSRRYWDLRRRELRLNRTAGEALAHARNLILEAETSCFLFWGDEWIPRLSERAVSAQRELDAAEQELGTTRRPVEPRADDQPPGP